MSQRIALIGPDGRTVENVVVADQRWIDAMLARSRVLIIVDREAVQPGDEWEGNKRFRRPEPAP